MKEHQNDRYLTTQDGEVFDRLTNSFVVDIEPINTYEKMPQKVDGDNAEAVAETILEALSAYEKLQGVDLDLMASVYEEERAKYINGRSATMTDKIKEAHEWHKDGTLLYTLKHAGWENGVEQFQNETTIKVEGDNAEGVAETILKALSAYEKLQGVDLDRLLVDIQVLEDVVKIPDVPSMSCLRRAAQTLADIGGDGR